MANANPTYRDAPAQLPEDVLIACVDFLKRKNIIVMDPTAPVAIAQAMLVYMGVGTQHPVNGINHAIRVIDTFYKSRVNKAADTSPAPMGKVQKRKKAKAEKKKAAFKAYKAAKKKPVVPRDAFYASVEWKRVRYEALKKSSGRCECCGVSPKEGAILNVDHIKPRRRFPALALDVTNLQVLCASCNHGKGSWDRTDWRAPEPEQNEKTPLDWEYERIMRDSV